MSKNFQAYLKLNKKGLEDKYVVIIRGNVIGRGRDIEKLLSLARKRYPKETPLVAKVPSEEVLIL